MILILIWNPDPDFDTDHYPELDPDSDTDLFCDSNIDLDPDPYPDLRNENWSLSWPCSEVLIQIMILIRNWGPDVDLVSYDILILIFSWGPNPDS